jgi:hypothetical protein
MLSQLLQKKHTKNFHVYDIDGSGFVELADLELCASNIAKLRNWEPDSSEFIELKAKYSAIWTNFWQPADISGDGKVSLEEYLKVADNSIIKEAGGRRQFLLEVIPINKFRGFIMNVFFLALRVCLKKYFYFFS